MPRIDRTPPDRASHRASRPWPPSLPPGWAQVVQHLLLAGPLLGGLGAVYRYLLSTRSPSAPNAASDQVVRYTKVWHGHYFGSFYVTPGQDLLLHALALAGLAWMIAVIAVLVRLGMKGTRARPGA